MNELGPKAIGLKSLKDDEKQVDSSLPMAFITNRRAKPSHEDYTILEDLWSSCSGLNGF